VFLDVLVGGDAGETPPAELLLPQRAPAPEAAKTK
jgi:hypothetical protein